MCPVLLRNEDKPGYIVFLLGSKEVKAATAVTDKVAGPLPLTSVGTPGRASQNTSRLAVEARGDKIFTCRAVALILVSRYVNACRARLKYLGALDLPAKPISGTGPRLVRWEGGITNWAISLPSFEFVDLCGLWHYGLLDAVVLYSLISWSRSFRSNRSTPAMRTGVICLVLIKVCSCSSSSCR